MLRTNKFVSELWDQCEGPYITSSFSLLRPWATPNQSIGSMLVSNDILICMVCTCKEERLAY